LDEAQPPKTKKRKKGVSRTQRSLKKLRQENWTVAVVERWNSFVGVRQDLFGFVDIIAVSPKGTMAVQVCAGQGDVAKHLDKIMAEPRAVACAAAGWKIVLHAWRLLGARGKRKLWECAEIEVVLPKEKVDAYRASSDLSELSEAGLPASDAGPDDAED
jgi:hypothetical protein